MNQDFDAGGHKHRVASKKLRSNRRIHWVAWDCARWEMVRINDHDSYIVLKPTARSECLGMFEARRNAYSTYGGRGI
jgi:hypothetical protein